MSDEKNQDTSELITTAIVPAELETRPINPKGRASSKKAKLSAERKPHEDWGKQHKTPAHLVTRARLCKGWPLQKHCTEQEFLTALQDAASVQIR